MMNPLYTLKKFVRNLGAVEQAQVVASTAVIVSMATIITAMVLTQQAVRLMDFISILTVGTIGFTSVYFTLRYGRQLDAQRRQLFALNTIAEAVNQVVELDYVLQTALRKATELLDTGYGWIYMLEGNHLVLKSSKGTTMDFLDSRRTAEDPLSTWLHQPRVEREGLHDLRGRIHPSLKQLGIQFWASIPLRAKDSVAGTLIVAGREFDMFTTKQAELMEAFGNHISVALNNAQLFDRLKKSEQKYIDLFENSPDMYLSVTRQHVIAGCNNTGAEMLGYPKHDIIGKLVEDLFVEEKRSSIRQHIATMFEEGRGLKNLEEQIVLKDGRRIHVTLNSSLVFDEAGASVNARIVARDITEFKMMEAAVLHAQKIDSIGSLAGGIAHDFNNILASVLGSASIMRRKLNENDRLYKYVQIIEGAARRGSSLTRQLLTFARKTETVTKTVNVNSLIEETLHMFERSVSKEIVVKTDLTTDAAIITGDEGQIQQALLNLFLNARDAMPSGGTLSVSTKTIIADAHLASRFVSFKPGPFVVITATDTGTGMDKKVQDRVFEPFFTTKDHGTGLGLSVTYGVVQNHGGFIDLESELGRGSTFSIYLPRSVEVGRTEMRHKRQRLPRGKENILVVDDELSVCEIARDMLTDLGYSVDVVHDGKAGVDYYKARQGSIDLVLLDMNMPLMGGIQAFEQFRAINSNLRIIILTGYGRGVIETPDLTAAVNAFVQKPFQVEELALKVRQVLDARTTQAELTS